MFKKQICDLPFLKCAKTFENIFEKIMESEILTPKIKQYFKQIHQKKEEWARCFNLKVFTAGITTNARIESFNASIKRFLNSTTPINFFFKAIDEYERSAILKTEIEE